MNQYILKSKYVGYFLLNLPYKIVKICSFQFLNKHGEILKASEENMNCYGKNYGS